MNGCVYMDMDFGKKIQMLRKSHGISQETLANILNINRNNLSRIETGKSEPNLSIIKDIVKYFNVDAASLIGISKEDVSSKEKIKMILDNCNYLLDNDLDFLVRLTSTLREEFIKKGL